MRSNGLSSHHKTTQPCRAGGMVKKQNFLFVGRLDDREYALRTRCELQLAGPTLGADLKCRNFELRLRKQKFRESTTDSNPITNHQDPITIPEHRVSRDYNHTTNPDHRIRQNNRRSLKPPHPGAPPPKGRTQRNCPAPKGLHRGHRPNFVLGTSWERSSVTPVDQYSSLQIDAQTLHSTFGTRRCGPIIPEPGTGTATHTIGYNEWIRCGPTQTIAIVPT